MSGLTPRYKTAKENLELARKTGLGHVSDSAWNNAVRLASAARDAIADYRAGLVSFATANTAVTAFENYADEIVGSGTPVPPPAPPANPASPSPAPAPKPQPTAPADDPAPTDAGEPAWLAKFVTGRIEPIERDIHQYGERLTNVENDIITLKKGGGVQFNMTTAGIAAIISAVISVVLLLIAGQSAGFTLLIAAAVALAVGAVTGAITAGKPTRKGN